MAQAAVLVSDNFDDLADGTDMASSANWNAKWDGNNETQRNLYKGNGNGSVTLDTTVAWRNYHALHQTGFQVGGADGHDSVTISSDISYVHAAGGDISANLNEAFFGLFVSNTAPWWSGGGNANSESLLLANRGAAVGNKVNGSPWIEDWTNHSSLGVDTSTGGESSTINIAWTLSDNGTTIDAAAVITRGGSTFETTLVDTTLASGSTLYGGYSTGWNGVGNVPISDVNAIESVTIDNFSISAPDAVPEPSSVILASLAALGLLRRRR